VGPKEVVPFEVIHPLLHELRQWLGNMTLVKIKSHKGCLLNEREDEQLEVDMGWMAEGPVICPGTQKYRSFWLRVHPAVRDLTERCGKTPPRDSATDRCLLGKTSSFNALIVRKRSTVFATDLLHYKQGDFFVVN
jgi:hypothetical protein